MFTGDPLRFPAAASRGLGALPWLVVGASAAVLYLVGRAEGLAKQWNEAGELELKAGCLQAMTAGDATAEECTAILEIGRGGGGVGDKAITFFKENGSVILAGVLVAVLSAVTVKAVTR